MPDPADLPDDLDDDELDPDDADEDADDGEHGEPGELPKVGIGTVDLPDRMDRGRYFRQLSYLELSAWFAGPLKPSAVTKWAEVAPKGSLGLVAPWVLTQRKPPNPTKSWVHDATVGDFRDSGPGRVALAALVGAVQAVSARCVVFRSPPLFAASAANRDTLRRFFGEIATTELLGVPRVWIPDGLWEPKTAVKFATEIGVTCSVDPLVRDPAGSPDLFFELEAESLYFRVEALGRAGTLRTEKQEELAALLEHYESIPVTVAFASAQRWSDAKNLKKVLASPPSD
jgi:hypothetical protein